MEILYTFNQFVSQNTSPKIDNKLVLLLNDISLACRIISSKLRNNIRTANNDKSCSLNSSGDFQTPLDIISNQVFIDICENNGLVSYILSEEMAQPYKCKNSTEAKYILAIDPLDGSGNLPINGPVSTIFSVCEYPNLQKNEKLTIEHLLKSVQKPIVAGCTLYGLSTFMYITIGNGVHGFTYDTNAGEFFYTHPNIKINDTGKIIAVNISNKLFWSKNIIKYIDDKFKKGYNMRWYASAAAELRRILNQGGIFIYPADSNNKPNGVLRKVYEGYPLAFITEQAGGIAINGKERILDINVKSLHEKTPIIYGSKKEVKQFKKYCI